MKKLLIGIPVMLFVIFISSCDGSKKTSENQNSGTAATAPVEKSDASTAKDQAKQDARVQPVGNQNSEGISGTQLIDNSTSRMTTKLNLTNSQPSAVKGILTQTFLASGEKMDNVYTNEQYRTVSRDIITKSSDAIMSLLDDSQKDTFKKFVQH